jgi:uncharacterized glyoxalase superfamily protein PhnB
LPTVAFMVCFSSRNVGNGWKADIAVERAIRHKALPMVEGKMESRVLRAAPELPVSDMDRALLYYDETLGFRTKMTMPGGEYAVVERDDVALHLFRADEACSPMSLHLFASGIDALYEEVQDKGADLKQPLKRQPWGNRDFRVLDPFGNEIKFTEPQDN